MSDKPRKPVSIADALAGFLGKGVLAKRLEQSGAVTDWPNVVGPQIAAVTKPLSITPDGTLFIAVTTNSWMTELSLMEPELLTALNGGEGRGRVRKIRFQLQR